jgi:hypothetical protein
LSIEGKLYIRLVRDGSGVGSVDIRSTRPLGATRLLIGQSPKHALEVIPRIHHLCGYAQSFAALGAIRQATEINPPEQTLLAQRCLVEAEIIREHGLRILLDWARFLGEAPSPAAKSLARFPAACRQALFGNGPAFAANTFAQPNPDHWRAAVSTMAETVREHIFGMSVDDWPAGYGNDRDRWIDDNATIAARFLHAVRRENAADLGICGIQPLAELADDPLREHLAGPDADDFVARPTWDGQPRENSALPRATPQTSAPGLLNRLLARLDHVAGLVSAMNRSLDAIVDASKAADQEKPTCGGTGLGRADSARGRLYHYAAIDSGRITDYRILAPTEWNFHPQGVVAEGLKTLNWIDESTVRQRAAWFINAIDPCVGFDLELA